MWIFILRRIFYIFPVILGVSLILFIIFNVIGDNPALTLLGKTATAEQIAAVEKELGIDQPLFMQYLHMVKSAFTYDFGRSWNTHQDIATMIWERGKVSLSFTLPAFFIATIISILISLIVALYRGKGIDIFIRSLCIAMISISSLVYILVGQNYLAYEFGWFEISGYEEGFPNYLPYVILPGLIWIVLSLGGDIRFFRTIMLDEIYQDYVRTARAKGLKESTVLLKHVLKNALVPIITYTFLQIPFLILGAILLESFFSIPGLGSLIIDSMNSSDYPSIKAITLVVSQLYIVFSLFTDVFYTLVDPRVSLK